MPRASVTDVPLTGKASEALGIIDYAEAMVEFIRHCDTPLTIGIQGEWGSGKTSLMHMIHEDMDSAHIASSWVNTWEHSMFRTPAETVPAVLRGMLEGLRLGFKNDEWPYEAQEKMAKVSKVLKGFGRLAVNVAGSKAIGQENVFAYFEGDEIAPQRAAIAQIKSDLAEVITRVVEAPTNKYDKVVFFIDDLDRLEPPIAVAVLEAIKNIFDLPYCVFLLAIDYDVVVKGLAHKFGPKTPENEREFRSFFDKIIQVPFSMPVGAYDIDRMLRQSFGSMGLEMSEAMSTSYRDLVANTVGGNPRSIKRYANTYSLLRRLRRLQKDAHTEGARHEIPAELEDFLLFALIGIQIAYPRIYSMLVKDPDFLTWSIAESSAAQGASHVGADREALSHNAGAALPQSDLLDEEWEKFVWLSCQSDAWLRARVTSILTILNRVRSVVGDDELGPTLSTVLQLANVTSVEDDPATRSRAQQRIRYDDWGGYEALQKERELPADVLADQKALHDWILSAFGPDAVEVSLTPSMISYKPLNGGRRGKVFVYSQVQKRAGVRLSLCPEWKWFTYREHKGPDRLPMEGLQKQLRNSYDQQKR